MTKIADYRYYVDMRIGCCGIIDNKRPRPNTQFLSSDNSNVVFFWEGKLDKESDCWYVPLEIEIRANKICLLLNEMEKLQNG